MQTFDRLERISIYFSGSPYYDILILVCLINQESGEYMQILVNSFGMTENGESIQAYQLIGKNLFSVTVLSFGGIISEIQAPDRNGDCQNVVLGYNYLRPYETFSPYFGALIGRVAGRISQGNFTLGDSSYSLAQNNNLSCLHGGTRGFAFKIYDVEPFETEKTCGVILRRRSPHMEEGFPGNLDLEVIYTITDENALIINYHATTDQATPVTLTNHSYFNLSGKPNTTIENHLLTIRADHYGQIDEDVVPTEIRPVDNTPFDFRVERRIGDALQEENQQLAYGKGFDHPFCLIEGKPHVTITDPESGRSMSITTTEKTVVVYAGNYLGDLPDEPLTHGQRPHDYEGICFETQAFPDAVHNRDVDSIILTPEQTYESKTTYQFGIV